MAARFTQNYEKAHNNAVFFFVTITNETAKLLFIKNWLKTGKLSWSLTSHSSFLFQFPFISYFPSFTQRKRSLVFLKNVGGRLWHAFTHSKVKDSKFLHHPP